MLFAEIRWGEWNSFVSNVSLRSISLDISLLTEREVYSKGSQNKAENVQNWWIKLMNLCFNLRFTTHSVFLIVALRVKKWLVSAVISTLYFLDTSVRGDNAFAISIRVLVGFPVQTTFRLLQFVTWPLVFTKITLLASVIAKKHNLWNQNHREIEIMRN